jgi:hypothetical protein
VAKRLPPAVVAGILKSGALDDLVGAIEDEHLECKGAPYQLEYEHQCYELAKDVSMIVNRSARTGSEGGHLILGVRTEKSDEYRADVVVEVRPFARGLVDAKQYLDVLRAWLTPTPEGLDMQWYASAADPTRGVFAISVPPQPRDRWPCIVGKVIDAAGKRRGVAVAYVERYGEHAVEWTPADLQRLLREGARADLVSQQLEALSSRVDALADQVQKQQLAQPPPAPPGPSEAARSYRVRLGEAVTAAGLQGSAVYALTAAPVDTVALPGLFRGPKEPLPRLLPNSPRLRVGGWDMSVRDELAVVEGRVRRGVVSGYKILECWPDGTLIHAAEAQYLCWGPKTRGAVRRVNPMALAESTYLFAKLAEAVYADHAAPKPTAVRFGLALHRLDVGATTKLSSGGIKSAGFLLDMDVRDAPKTEAEFTYDVGKSWTPGEVSYQLCRSVYTWFGFTEDAIPYALEENGTHLISPEQILADVG